MTRTLMPLTAALAVAAIKSLPAVAASHGVPPKATITMEQARRIALDAWPGGKIMKQELEQEGGGSGLRYSFDMKQGQKWREVGVDAVTGKVLENKAEKVNPRD